MASLMVDDDTIENHNHNSLSSTTLVPDETTPPIFTDQSPALCLHVHALCQKARASTMYLPHGEVKLPIFMPVGTKGTIKGLSSQQLLQDQELSPQIILGNTYHLALQPGTEILDELGGKNMLYLYI